MRQAALLLALATAARADLFVDYSRTGTRTDFSQRRVWIRENPPAMRVEYPFDPGTKRAGTRLVVDGETYLIDRATKRAFILPASEEPKPLVYPEALPPFNEMLFGQEIEFFRGNAAWQGEDTYEDAPCDYYKHETEEVNGALRAKSGTDRPLDLVVSRGSRTVIYVFKKYSRESLSAAYFVPPKNPVRVANLQEALDLLAETDLAGRKK